MTTLNCKISTWNPRGVLRNPDFPVRLLPGTSRLRAYTGQVTPLRLTPPSDLCPPPPTHGRGRRPAGTSGANRSMTPDSHTLQDDRAAYRRWAARAADLWTAKLEAATLWGTWRSVTIVEPTTPWSWALRHLRHAPRTRAPLVRAQRG